jgi:large subunit ribosomal protein L9
MEVLLLKDVPKLGRAGDTIRVTDGYARNYLFPRQLARPLDEGVKKQVLAIRDSAQRKADRVSQETGALARRLDGVTLTIQARVGEHGKLYGSVTSADIAELLAEKHSAEVDRRKIELEEPIREVGTHDVELRLTPQAVARIHVLVEGIE